MTQPSRKDITFADDTCIIRIKKAKNLQKYGQFKDIIMQAAPNPLICPVRAIKQVLQDTPTVSDEDPIFIFPDTYRPVPASFILSELHKLLARVGLGKWISCTSLHSIRKQAVTDAFMGRCSETSRRNYGGWSSQAYQTYITTSNRHVNSTLIQSLHNNDDAI